MDGQPEGRLACHRHQLLTFNFSPGTFGRVVEEEFKSLYDLMSVRIYSFAARRLSPAAAHDIVGETFEVAWAKRFEWPEEADARAGWVFTIAKFKILQEAQRSHRKHHDNRFVADYSPRASSERDVADVVAEASVGQHVYSQLSQAETELFDVAFMQEISRPQAAAMLGLNVIAFNTRVSRLRSKIERLLEAGMAEEAQA